MSSKINISIPKPCHENWQEMDIVEKGSFCNSCQKTVYDFTQLSDRQLIHKINSEPNTCGRFLATQLNKDLRIPKEKSSIWMAGVSGVLSFLSLGNQEVYAQENVKTEQTEGKSNVEKTTNDLSSVSDIEVTGVVFDQDHDQYQLPLPGVSVFIKGKSNNTQTDFDGKFSIKASSGDLLEFDYVGYKKASVTVTSTKPIIVKLESKDMLIGEVIIVRRTFFGRIFHSIGNLFR